MSLSFTPEQLDGFEVNRCYRGKIQTFQEQELYEALQLTHQVFNTRVAAVCRHIFRVLNDPSNPEFAKLTRWAIKNITPAGQCASHFANPFTLQESRANPTHFAYNKAEEMKTLFLLCKERGNRWYDRNEVFGSLIESRGGGSGLVAEVNQSAIEKVSAYLSLMDNWRYGNATPLSLMKEEQFVKEAIKFVKDNKQNLAELWQKDIDSEDIKKDTELYEVLLSGKRKDQESLLKDIHRHRLAYGWLLAEFEELYQSYSNKALGKSALRS